MLVVRGTYKKLTGGLGSALGASKPKIQSDSDQLVKSNIQVYNLTEDGNLASRPTQCIIRKKFCEERKWGLAGGEPVWSHFRN